MHSFFRRDARSARRAGFGLQPEGIAVAVVEEHPGAVARVKNVDFYPCAGPESHAAVLGGIVSDLKLKDVAGVCALEPGEYNLLQVEAPEVNSDELCKAVRWRIKDLLDFHVDDAVIDVFDLPEPSRPGAKRMLSVVASRSTDIRRRVDLMEEAGIRLEAIDITELAVRNVAVLDESGPGAQLFLYLAPRYGLIEITLDGLLYLSRRIEIDARGLAGDDDQPELVAVESWDLEGAGVALNGSRDELMDSLVLELQRSMDYYETQFEAGPVTRIRVVPVEPNMTERFIRYASENLAVTVEEIQLEERIDGLDEVPDEIIERCLPALGAALRRGS
ncbi:MAG TPA: hypothetical protein EYH03_00995 [Chromatiales bacterium]|nr:hypothetical protein [Chromatiales bacterium]